MKALGDSIIFTFREKIRNGMFVPDQTSTGGLIVMASAEDSSKKLRTVDVKFVGPDVKDVKVGDAIIVEPLMWTDEFKLNGISYWKTAEKHVIAVVED